MKPPNFRAHLCELEADKEHLNILLPAGIGDLAWALSKLHGLSKVRGNIVFHVAAEEQRRAKQYADLVGIELRYMPGLKTKWVWDHQGNPALPETGAVVVHANSTLENGRRIETWYPELPMAYPVPDLSKYHDTFDEPFVMMFACEKNYMGGQLEAKEWQEIARSVSHLGQLRFIAAGKDVAFLNAIGIGQGDIVNQHIGDVLAAVVNPLCRGVVGVAGGPTILATLMGAKTFMFYPNHLALMPQTWEMPDNQCQWCYLKPFDPESPLAQFRGQRPAMGAMESARSGAIGEWLGN